jgi:DNA polymerase-3 subunit delta
MAAKTKIPEHPVYLVHGDDEFLVAEKAREIVNALCPSEQQGEVLEVIEGLATKGEEVELIFKRVRETLQTMGMFSEEKIIWLRDCTFLPDCAVSKYEAVKTAIKQFEELLKAGLPSDRKVIISASSKVSGRSAFFKTCGKVGEVYTFVKNDQPHKVVEDAIGMVSSLLKERGISASHNVIVNFASRVGNDTRQLVNEADKLDIYLGPDRRDLEVRDVALMVAPGRELAAWQLADAVVERNLPLAMQTLSTLLAQKQSEMAIIGGLSRRFRELSLYRALVDSGKAKLTGRNLKWEDPAGQELAIATLGRKPHPYVEMLTAQAARNFSRTELAKGRKLIAETHNQLLNSALPKKLQLELLLLKLLEKKSG